MVATPSHLFDKTMTFVPVTAAAGGTHGEWSESDGTSLTGVRVRIQPMSGAEAVRYGRESTRRMWRIYTKPGQGITETHRGEYTDAGGTAHTYDIIEVVDLQEHGAVTRIIAEETL